MVKLTKNQQVQVEKQVEKEVYKRLKERSRRLLEKASTVRTEFKKQTTTALIAAFGLVIALSWQTVIKKIVENITKSGILLYHPYLADLYTAIVVTLLGTVAILIITKWSSSMPTP